MASTGLPSLTEIRNWDIEHLRQAADDWEPRAARWVSTYEQNYRRLAETDWKGQGREAHVERAGLDLVKVRGLGTQLQEAAVAARYGFDQQNGAKQWTLDAVTDGEQAGFRANEDLSVTDRQTGGSAAARAARQTQAQTLSADIRHRAALLVASNREIAAKITAAAGNIGEFSFDEPAGIPHGGIQLVDYQPPQPERPHLIYCHEIEPGGPWLCEVHDLGGGPPQYIEMPGDYSGWAD
jgi:hypothetical protein